MLSVDKQANNLVHVLVEVYAVANDFEKIDITMVMVFTFILFDDVQTVLPTDEDVMLGNKQCGGLIGTATNTKPKRPVYWYCAGNAA